MSSLGRRVLLLAALAACALSAPTQSGDQRHHRGPDDYADPRSTTARLEALANVPLTFETNAGQADPAAAFIARGRGYVVQIADHRARVRLAAAGDAAPDVLDMEVVGASRRARAKGRDPQAARSHYLIGNDPARHIRDVPHVGKVAVEDIYPGIDLVYHGRQSTFEYDFVVAPGADPAPIALRFSGHDAMAIAENGDLVFRFGDRELRHARPVLYQLPGDDPVDGRFAMADDGTVQFDLGR
jgi:hypothetical protein